MRFSSAIEARIQSAVWLLGKRNSGRITPITVRLAPAASKERPMTAGSEPNHVAHNQ